MTFWTWKTRTIRLPVLDYTRLITLIYQLKIPPSKIPPKWVITFTMTEVLSKVSLVGPTGVQIGPNGLQKVRLWSYLWATGFKLLNQWTALIMSSLVVNCNWALKNSFECVRAFHIELEFGNVGFWQEEKTGAPKEKFLEGIVAEGLEPRVQVPPWPLAGFVHGSPEFKSSTTVVNSQLLCLRPVGILNLLCVIWIICFSLLGPTNISALNTAKGK